MNTPEWTVVGAGPAGIVVIGKLIDSGCDPKTILWVDPAFAVGDLGQKWSEVLGNTDVKLFRDYLNSCRSFCLQECDIDFAINHLPSGQTCKLSHVVEPLKWITERLIKKVRVLKEFVTEIEHNGGYWVFKTSSGVVKSKKIILAIGAKPKKLHIDGYYGKIISLENALNPNLLKDACNESDVVAVFGSSHSAIVAMYNLMDRNVKKIINFYKSPLKYTFFQENYTLYTYNGIKGYAADWARHNLEEKLPDNLQRIHISDEQFMEKLNECSKAVYAVGFERRTFPKILPYGYLPYDQFLGILAKGLFGIGIGFPELKKDALGVSEYAIGLIDFAEYADKILKIWSVYE